MKRVFGALLALGLVGQTSPSTTVDDLAWLSGRWESVQDGQWTEESWSVPRGGIMLGFSRSARGGPVRAFEFLRLAADVDGVPTYYAQPGGRPAVAFRLAARERTSATFENPAHDFPQRIHYVRSGETMTATISAIDGSRPMRWSYRRQ